MNTVTPDLHKLWVYLAASPLLGLTAMVFGYKPKPNFTVDNEAQLATPPKVDFGTGTAASGSRN